jgi:hypothetical protein
MSALAGENASMAIADHLPPLLPSLANASIAIAFSHARGDAVGYANEAACAPVRLPHRPKANSLRGAGHPWTWTCLAKISSFCFHLLFFFMKQGFHLCPAMLDSCTKSKSKRNRARRAKRGVKQN